MAGSPKEASAPACQSPGELTGERPVISGVNSAGTARISEPMRAEAGDIALVRRVQKGDKSAFDALVLKYQHKVLKLVQRYVRNPSEAEDIAQEAFIKAYRALPAFRGDSAFYTWLYRIAINTAKNALVASRRRPVSYDLDLQDGAQVQAHARLSDTETPEALALTDEIRRTVNEAIEALPDDLRLAIDDDLRGALSRYSLIGAVLRSDGDVPAARQVAARVSAAIAREPARGT